MDATTEAPPAEATDDTPDATDAPPDEKVKSEDDWQTKARKHEREAKKARAESERLRKQLDEHEAASKSEQEKALDAARKEAAGEATKATTASFQGRILEAEIKAAAAGKFKNPSLASKLLDLDIDEVFSEDGELDRDAIAKAVDDFLESEPDLKAGPPNGGRPTGDADAGRGEGSAGSRAKQLEDMTVDEHFQRIRKHK